MDKTFKYQSGQNGLVFEWLPKTGLVRYSDVDYSFKIGTTSQIKRFTHIHLVFSGRSSD